LVKKGVVHIEEAKMIIIGNQKFNFRVISLAVFTLLCSTLVLGAFAEQGFFVPKDPPKALYVIEAKLGITGNTLTVKGEETISFKNPVSKPLSVIAIHWEIQDKQSIDISMNGESLELLNPEMGLSTKSPLYYKLPKEIKRETEVMLNIEFALSYPSNVNEIHLRAWHPTFWWEGIPTQDEYKVKLDMPSEYTLAISGRLNEKSGYYENRNVTTSFKVFLAKNMKTEEREVEGVRITSLFTPEGEECARFCLETAVDVVKFYKEWHGFYPFDFLYIIPGASRPMGGYPYASGIVVIHGQQKFKDKPLLHWKWITAHEIGHQYWGEYVMSDDYPYGYTSSWLMIGMGICADRAYTVSRKMGDEKHTGFLERYKQGLISRYDTTADAPESLRLKQKYDRNNVLIHGKGYSILSALESVVGEETFEKIYMKCVKSYGGKRLGYRDFWRICEEVTGDDLGWFFEQWVRSAKYLCYQIISQESKKQGDRFITYVTVERKGSSISMPVPVKVFFEDGSNQASQTNRFLKTEALRFESQSPFKDAVINPENKLAMLDEPLAILPEKLPDAINKLPWSGAPKDALELYKKAVEVKLDIFQYWFKLGMCVFEGGYYTEAFDSFKRMTDLKLPKSYHFYALVWMGNVMDAQGKREEAVKYYKESLKYDTGSATRHDQFKIESSREWVEERLKTPFNWKRIIKKN